MEWEDAEARLDTRSQERRDVLARRDRRRRLLPWLLCPLLAALGGAGLLALLRGELRDGELVPAAACVLVPTVVAGWIGRYHGRLDAVLWALVTAALTVALALGVGLVALDLGP